MDTVDIIVGSVDESGCVHLMLALVASKALLVEGPTLGNLFLCLKHTALTSRQVHTHTMIGEKEKKSKHWDDLPDLTRLSTLFCIFFYKSETCSYQLTRQDEYVYYLI